jgi:hypothetical protein
VIVNTAKGTVGEDVAALVGGTLINLVGLLVGEQAGLPENRRRPVTLLVDEFHTMPGADYEAILSELAKYGANLVLATQSLARLEALDREQVRALRATVFANLDGLFAFHTSAEDARYLVRELGGEVDEGDLLELGEHRCYARLSAGGERLPTFSMSLDPPPAGDPAVGDELARASTTRYGRDVSAVEEDLRSALARIEQARAASLGLGWSGRGGGTVGDPGRTVGEAEPSTDRGRRRNEGRPPKRKRSEPYQTTFLDGEEGSVIAEDSPPAPDEAGVEPDGEHLETIP